MCSRRIFWVAQLALLCWLAGPQARAQAPTVSPNQWVQRLQTKYDEIQSFSAHFRQIFRGPYLEIEESGNVWMKRPGKMRWEYEQPSTKLFISDGVKIYFYVPKDNQVMVADLSLDLQDMPLLFLIGRGDIQENFQVELDPKEDPLAAGNPMLRLTPRKIQAHFSFLIVEIDPALVVIRRLAIIEPLGNRNDYILTGWRENLRIDNNKFRFQIPAGVEVLQTGS